MTQEERQFIVSVKEGKTQWDLLGVPGIENLPAVRWKLQNIRRMAPRKHQEALRKLRDYLGRIAARSILPGLPRYKWQETIELHNERTVASGTEIAILQA